MKPNYDNAYAPDNVYGHVIELLRRHRPVEQQEGVHLDLGCGYGRIAEAMHGELSRHYVGVDLDADGVEAIRQRGLEAAVVDLNASAEEIRQRIDVQLGGRRVASVTLIDVLEHVFLPGPLLDAVRSLVQEHGSIFVMSVPNLAHRDVGFKLALGRYDMTTAGLLDHTHVQPFTATLLDDMLLQHGLHTVDRHDVQMVRSDQQFPALHPALTEGTVLSDFLRGLRDRVDVHATTNQLVVACLAGPRKPAVFRLQEAARQDTAGNPFLSIVTRTQGRRASTLNDLFLSLSAQTCSDFEVVLVGHRLDVPHQIVVEEVLERLAPSLREKVRFMRLDHGNRTAPLNFGFTHARGDYVTILDDDDLPMAHWVETFRDMARAAPGQVLRSVAVRQECDWVTLPGSKPVARTVSGYKHDYPERFDLLAHLVDNQTPGLALAFPRAVFHDMGTRFDEDLTTAEDWEFAMRCAVLCGVHSSPEVTCIYRWWVGVDGSRKAHTAEEWRNNHQRIYDKMDASPLLLPRGASRLLRDLIAERDGLRLELEHARAHIDAMALVAERALPVHLPVHLPVDASFDAQRHALRLIVGSFSWRLTAPLRRVSALLKGQPSVRMDVDSMDGPHVLKALEEIPFSTSWRVTRPLRWVKRIVA